MLCPTCQVDLIVAERQNVEIDYCPKCRGVWLDRGELDKIIERSAQYSQPEPRQAPQPVQPMPQQPYPTAPQPGYHKGHGYGYGYGYGHGHKKKKRGFLDDIFDF